MPRTSAIKGYSPKTATWTLMSAVFVTDVVWIANAPIHPAPLVLFPHSAFHVDLIPWDWALAKSMLGQTHDWWIQFIVVVALLDAGSPLDPPYLPTGNDELDTTMRDWLKSASARDAQ